jgi:hypothetical protein
MVVVREEVVDMKSTVSPSVVENNVEYKYAFPVLYSVDISVDV